MSQSVLRAAVVGASGYTGVELLRLLLRHPFIEITRITSEKHSGQPMEAAWPHLRPYGGRLVFEPLEALLEADTELADLHVVFLALPHATASKVVISLLDKAPHLKVIDLSADFRLKKADVYERWYGPHPRPGLLSESVYAFVENEDHARELKTARLVACPGCFPTAVLLATLPLIQSGSVQTDAIVANCLTGISGAGRHAKTSLLFSEITTDGSWPYSVGGHRHQPEIEQEMNRYTDEPVGLTFLPHVVPMSRGLLATCTLRIRGISLERVHGILCRAYERSALVDVLPLGTLPSTGLVVGTARAAIGLAATAAHDDHPTVAVVSAIDNLGKGAAGQAIQACNLMHAWPESTGLEDVALWPGT